MHTRFVGISEVDRAPQVAVVVDVMRAFTVAAWVFARGADKIVLAETVDDALAIKAGRPDWLTLKDGPPAPGFDAVNSPALVRTLDLEGRTVVQKTTNGTVGAFAAKEASLLLCASFAVAEATAQLLRATRPGEVTFVVTGDGGRAGEDLACAEYIAQRADGLTADAGGFLERAARSTAADDLAESARLGIRGVYPDDVALCLETDRFSFAMAAAVEDSMLVLRPVAVASPGTNESVHSGLQGGE